MAERIGIFGGTFDPVHNGHLSIAESFLNSGYIDELWILPSPDPPHKTEEPVSDFVTRIRMLKAGFSGFENVRISDLESKLVRPSYTIRTLEHLKEHYPEKEFYLCIGEDSLSEFDTWFEPERILQECELLVAARPGADAGDISADIRDRTHFVDHVPIAISSTDLREKIRRGEDVEQMVPGAVHQIIREENLYRN